MANQAAEFGRRVKDFRLDRLMSQPKAAVFFGVSLATICRIEAGKGCGDLTRAKIEKTLSRQMQAA